MSSMIFFNDQKLQKLLMLDTDDHVEAISMWCLQLGTAQMMMWEDEVGDHRPICPTEYDLEKARMPAGPLIR